MKKHSKAVSIFMFLIFCLIPACSLLSQGGLQGDDTIKPGDKIGAMTLEQGNPALPFPSMWYFCEPIPDQQEPKRSSADCQVPQMSGMTIEIGWFAKETNLEANWEAIDWSLTIDGNRIDLDSFEMIESEYIAHGEDNKSRIWLLNLMDLSPGSHTLQLKETMNTAVDDGFNIYQPGVYEHDVNFTILEEEVYPPLTSELNFGQHSFTSDRAGLDFLLFLPVGYGNDPQQEWPLILYLHGAYLRGSTLEMLQFEEPFPKKLAKETDFPFIVLSPLGDGDYEFWADDQSIDSLFVLLDEIQGSYTIDPARIYLTGNDMGGNGVWTIGLRNPTYFAALAPVAGYFSHPFDIPENICDLVDVPVRAYHGERDPFIPVEAEQGLVDALNACGGNAEIILSKDMKNDLPYKVYADPELYEWSLTQSHGSENYLKE